MTRKANTRTAQGSGNIRRRKDGVWEARYTVGRDPGTGKQIQKLVYGSTQKEVREQLRRITNQLDTGSYHEPCKQKLGDYLDEWYLNYVQGILKPYTVYTYRGVIKNHLKPHLGAVRLNELTADKVQKMIRALLQGDERRPPMHPKTIKNVITVLSSALEQARVPDENGQMKIIHNPCRYVRIPSVQEDEPVYLTDEQIGDFVRALEDAPLRLLYLITLFSGMREGEALGLDWSAVDFDLGCIRISQQLQKENERGGRYYILASTKSDRPRMIYLAPAVMDWLKEQWDAQQAMKQAAGPAWQENQDLWLLKDGRWSPYEGNLVFTNEFGGHYGMKNMWERFKKIALQIGVPNSTVHSLRHSFATVSLANGDDPKSVQSNLGHATAAFTLQRYAHANDRSRRESSARMEQYIRGMER